MLGERVGAAFPNSVAMRRLPYQAPMKQKCGLVLHRSSGGLVGLGLLRRSHGLEMPQASGLQGHSGALALGSPEPELSKKKRSLRAC